MDLNVKTITAENSNWIANSQILIEGNLSLPAELEAIETLLEVSGTSEITDIHIEENKIYLSGTAYFKILYMDVHGEFSGFDADSEFSQELDFSGAAPDTKVLAWSSLGDISYSPTDGRNLSIKAVAEVDIYAAGNQQYQILDGQNHEKYTQIKEKELTLSQIGCMNSSKTYISTQLRVPQSMPAVKHILSERGYAILRKIVVEDGHAAIEGELKIFIIYESTDKNAPLQHFEETIPFSEIIKDDALRSGSKVFGIANLETLATQPDTQDPDVLNISATIGLYLVSRRHERVQVIEDLFDEKKDVNLSYEAIDACDISEGECMKKILRLSAEIPASAPDISRILFSSAYPRILSSHEEGGVLSMDGIMSILLCYTTTQSGIQSLKLQIPFETELSYEKKTPEAELFIRCFGEYAISEGSGREIEIKCCMDLCVWEVELHHTSAVRAATFSTPETKKQNGIIIYYADGHETLWDIAKKFKVNTEHIHNVPSDGNIQKGQKLILISR